MYSGTWVEGSAQGHGILSEARVFPRGSYRGRGGGCSGPSPTLEPFPVGKMTLVLFSYWPLVLMTEIAWVLGWEAQGSLRDWSFLIRTINLKTFFLLRLWMNPHELSTVWLCGPFLITENACLSGHGCLSHYQVLEDKINFIFLIIPEAPVIPMKDTWASLSLLKLTYVIARGSHCLVYSTWGTPQFICVMHFCTDGSHKWLLFAFGVCVFYITLYSGHGSASAHVDSPDFLRDHSVVHSVDWDLFNQFPLEGCLSTCLQQKCNVFDNKITKLYWSKEMPPDGNSDPQEQMQKSEMRTGRLITPLLYMCSPFFL